MHNTTKFSLEHSSVQVLLGRLDNVERHVISLDYFSLLACVHDVLTHNRRRQWKYSYVKNIARGT